MKKNQRITSHNALFQKAISGQMLKDEFIGLEEDERIDFKEALYTQDAQGWLNLCKDVTAFANNNGGLLIFGCTTEKAKNKMTDLVVNVPGLSNMLEVSKIQQQWMAQLDRLVSPRFPRAKITFHKAQIEDVELLILNIPAGGKNRPYITSGEGAAFFDGKSKLKGAVFGCWVRNGAENMPMFEVHAIQGALAQSMRGHTSGSSEILVPYLVGIKEELARMNEGRTVASSSKILGTDKLSNLDTQTSTPPARKPNLVLKNWANNKIDEYSNILDAPKGYFYIFAQPHQEILIDPLDFWDEAGNAYKLLKEPPRFREMGWDQSATLGERPVPTDDSWRRMNGKRKVLEVTRRGELFAAGSIQGFLGYGVQNENAELLANINSMALAEYVATYTQTLFLACDLLELPGVFRVEAGIASNNTAISYRLTTQFMGFPEPINESSINPGAINQNIDVNALGSPARVSASILLDVYRSIFKLSGERLPFLIKNEAGQYVVSEGQFIKN